MTFKTRKEIDAFFEERIRWIPNERWRMAKERRSGHPINEEILTVTYVVVNSEGKEIRRYENNEAHITGATVKNLVSFEEVLREIFEEGKQDEYYIEKHYHEEYIKIDYDPKRSIEQAEEYRTTLEENRKKAIAELERRIAHNERWKEACKWAKEHGVKYVSDHFNRFSTIRRNVIEAGLVEEWNATWPEWSIGVDE